MMGRKLGRDKIEWKKEIQRRRGEGVSWEK